MYHAKRKGGHRFFIHPYPKEGTDDRSMQIINFDQAIWRQELQTHFQPIVDLHSGKITAIEARVRWDGGLNQQLTAAGVLRAAQESQAHWLIDHTVLKQAVAAMVRLTAETIPTLPMAVNITAETCADDQSAAQLEEFLVYSGVKPEQLRLEFPYETLCHSSDAIVPLLQRLAAKGFAIAIDHVDSTDFKTIHFNEMPIQIVKLDEKLVKQALEDAASMVKIRDICNIAQRQGLSVGAEGVVRLEQLELLRQIGCHEGQGPLISRPSPLDHLIFLLKKGRCW
jgi:EAL domain-containing protein (putative c-di-GMP-specific phosphodiesterase class I)